MKKSIYVKNWLVNHYVIENKAKEITSALLKEIPVACENYEINIVIKPGKYGIGKIIEGSLEMIEL